MSEKAQLKEQIPLPAQAKAARKDVPYLRYLVLCCLGLTAAGYHLVDTMLSPIGSKHHAVKIIDAGLERFSEKRMTARGAEKLFLYASCY